MEAITMELTKNQVHENHGYFCEEENKQEKDSTTTNRQPILKRSLQPCLFLLKLFGLYYDCGDRKIGFLYTCCQAYVSVVNLVIFANFVYTASS